MARLKNALREHFVGAYDPTNPTKKPTEWFPLAKWISEITDDTEEGTDDTPFYDGDGTAETSVISVKGSYSVSGFYDPEDKAQKLIADKKYTTGEERKVWHKIISSDKTEERVGVSTVTEIKAGSGNAGDYEEFGCKLTFNAIPEKTVPVSG